MSFWSGEELVRRATSEKLISGFDPAHVECAAYGMRLGGQMFITQEGAKFQKQIDRGRVPGIIDVAPDQVVNVPPGQFAFLLTEETVRIPTDALGFISIKAGKKFKGLVNVSGFHVDPGWDGHLMFSVFNAGPTHIVLKRGEPLFLLWFASLTQTSASPYLYKPSDKFKEIPPKYIESLTGPVPSLSSLNRDVRKLQISAHRGDIAFGLVLLIVAALVALGVKDLAWGDDNKSVKPSDVNISFSQPSILPAPKDDRAPMGSGRQPADATTKTANPTPSQPGSKPQRE